jgi:hypothetical protein
VVDDRDVVGIEPADQVFGPTIEPRMAGVLDERAQGRNS